MRNLVQLSDGKPYKVFESNQRSIAIVFSILSTIYPKHWLDEISKKYRRSKITTESLIEDFFNFNVPRTLIIQDECYTASLLLYRQLFLPPEPYPMTHFCDVRMYPWCLSTSVEEPYSSSEYYQKLVREAFQRGDIETDKMSKSNLYNVCFVQNRHRVHQIKQGCKIDRFTFDTIAHARAHLIEADQPQKVRMVWGTPWLTLMIEAMILMYLFAYHLQSEDSPILWLFDMMTGGMYRLSKFLCPGMTYFCLDWSKFDKYAQYQVIDDIRNVWESCIDFGRYASSKEYPDAKPSQGPKSLKRLFKWMCHHTKYDPVRLPNGQRFKRRHAGIASGMLQTQFLDSSYNFVMITCILLELGIRPKFGKNMDFIKVLGDDSLLGLREQFNPKDLESLKDKISDIAQRRFGAILNKKAHKSTITQNANEIRILGYNYQDCTPVKSEEELIAGLLYPERRVGAVQIKSRALGYAHASMGYYPRFHAACQAIFNRFEHINELDTNSSDHLRYLSYLDILDDKFPSLPYLRSRLFNPETGNRVERIWPSWFFTEKLQPYTNSSIL